MAKGKCSTDSPIETPVSLSFKAPPKEEGGYPCEFVTSPPDLLPSECSVCLQIFREPHLISCCGHNYCRTCIGPVQKQNRPCPLCNEPNFTVLHNKGLQRSLNELTVRCVHRSAGCEWTGELGQFETHLNETPDPENQLTGCEYVTLECIHRCGGLFPRHSVDNHQTNFCPQRPFSCAYCQEYSSIHADVVYRHWPVCKKYPLSCPNHCTVYAIERQHLDHHLNTECPLKVIECEFQYAGCEVALPRKDMPAHTADNLARHVSLLASTNQKLTEDLIEKDEVVSRMSEEMRTRFEEVRAEHRREVDELKAENATLKDDLKQMKEVVAGMKHSLNRRISQVVDIEVKQKEESKRGDETLEQQISDLRRQLEENRVVLATQCHSVQAFIGLFPTEFSMPDFEDKRTHNLPWQSPSFYSHLQGYKVRLVVCVNGLGAGKGTHVSVYACLLRGEFDDRLQWPFRAEVTIQLLNQLADRNHATGTIHFTERTPDVYTSRVSCDERAENGWGQQKFIAHADLGYNSIKNRQYLKDDRLRFRITSVKLI